VLSSSSGSTTTPSTKRSHLEASAPSTVERTTEQAAYSRKVHLINAISYIYSSDSPILHKMEPVKKNKAAADDRAQHQREKRKQ
jgi:hypothetical protein